MSWTLLFLFWPPPFVVMWYLDIIHKLTAILYPKKLPHFFKQWLEERMLLQKLIIWQIFPIVTHLNLCKFVSIVNKKINVRRKNILTSKESQFNLQCAMNCKMAPHAFELVVLLPTVVHLLKWESHLLNIFKLDWGLSSSYLTNITSNGKEV